MDFLELKEKYSKIALDYRDNWEQLKEEAYSSVKEWKIANDKLMVCPLPLFETLERSSSDPWKKVKRTWIKDDKTVRYPVMHGFDENGHCRVIDMYKAAQTRYIYFWGKNWLDRVNIGKQSLRTTITSFERHYLNPETGETMKQINFRHESGKYHDEEITLTNFEYKDSRLEKTEETGIFWNRKGEDWKKAVDSIHKYEYDQHGELDKVFTFWRSKPVLKYRKPLPKGSKSYKQLREDTADELEQFLIKEISHSLKELK